MTCAKIPIYRGKKNSSLPLPSRFSSILCSADMEKLRRGFAGLCSTFSPAACWKSRSCVREGNQRGPGQMFPFTNAAKEQGMPSSLPWPYLHFTTYSNNHATSSLGKEKYQAAKECFIIIFVKRAKTKLFFMPVLKLYLVYCANETGHKYPKPHPL